MGNGLENVRNNTENAKEYETKALEEGEEVVAEVDEANGTLEGIKGLDIEQGILSAAETVKEGVKDDATEYMREEVHESLEEGKEKAGEVTDESQEQMELNDTAVNELNKIKDYGSEQAGEAIETADETSEEFKDYEETAENDVEESEEEHERQLEDIMG